MEEIKIAEVIPVKNWEDFEIKLSELQRKYQSYSVDFRYRGQPNSEWGLETTLERDYKSDVAILEYYRKVLVTHTTTSTFTEKDWKVPTYNEIGKLLEDQESLSKGDLPAYDYLIYLRHHGFPSPLLDWTASPYIAAYFAFEKINKDVENAAIFIYLKSTGAHEFALDKPNIFEQGPYIKSHKRHFLQQSRYTTCIQHLEENGQYIFKFVSHEKAFENVCSQANRIFPPQDILFKIVIPASEQGTFLKKLNNMNINAFSLFQSEDGLVKSLANQHFVFGGK